MQNSLVIYNYAKDKNSARHYVVRELNEMGGQQETINKLNNGEIYPTNSFLTDEVEKAVTVRVYHYNKLDPGERHLDDTTGKRIKIAHKDVWHREPDPKLARNKKEREERKPSREAGLLFRE